MNFNPKDMTIAELVALTRRLEDEGLITRFADSTRTVDPRPILVRWEDMPLSYVGPDGLDWERVKDIYTSKPDDEIGHKKVRQ